MSDAAGRIARLFFRPATPHNSASDTPHSPETTPTMISRPTLSLAALMATIAVLGGCQSVKDMTGSGSSSAPAPAPAAAPAPAPAPAAATKAGSDDTRHVKGINDWEGDITGKPAANSKFTQLTIGMSMKQVTDIVGPPTDQGAYITGKAFIPFYFGSDRYRHEMVYKSQGRLIFAGGSAGDFASGHLIWIIHNASEGGYR